MGDAAVSALVTQVMRTITSLLRQEFDLLWGFKDSVESIKDDFEQIQAVLEDAEKKWNQDKAVELWLKRLRSASLQIENVLEEISTEAKLRRLRKKRGVFRYRTQRKGRLLRVRNLFTSNQLVFRLKTAHKVKDIKKKLDAITLQSQRFGLSLTPSSSVKDTGVVGVMPDRETSSHIHDSSSIFGRDEEVEMVTKGICNNDIGKYENGEILVYGIWGMGGVGKTTLAQLVYNHERVKEYFESKKCWVYVSENFQVKEIIKKIMESLGGSNEATQLDNLQSSLKNILGGKRFLVVLDDVWIEEYDKWEELSKTLSCGKEGSIVLMTTRSQTTSKMMAKVPELQHNLGCLSKDDASLLFTKFAFAQGRVGDDMSLLEPIGKEMVKKCKGLPLAVKTLGSLMWSKRSASEWKHVNSSFQWELQKSKVLPALKLSYDNLLPHLKRCFGYCCLFPKGYEMKKDDVIQLWMSNGLIPPRGELDLYVIGEETFNCLLWRSFFQLVRVDLYGSNYFKMHDLMHDMTEDVMRHDCLVMDHASKDVNIPDEVLHLSSSRPEFLFSPQELRNLTQLRSLLMLGENINSESRIDQIFNHVYLRVLYLRGVHLSTLPKSICNLKLLKCLNLSYSDIVVLHESIIYLQNLQVLVLFFCQRLRKLPEGLRYMRGLQHLDIDFCTSLRHLPNGVKELTNLRKLSRFIIGKEISGPKIEELGDLNNLEGELRIEGLENVKGLSEAKSANLKRKTNLSVLTLQWKYIDEVSESEVVKDEEVLEGLEPNIVCLERLEIYTYGVSESEMVKYEEVLERLEPNVCLERLSIINYMGKSISPSWMVSLRNLVGITFRYCKKCEHINPALGRLPNLRVITLKYMYSLKCFQDDEKSMLGGTTDDIMFLSLQELIIRGCPKLVSLPSKLPNIRKLDLWGCNKLVSLPDEIQSFKDLNQLYIRRCKDLSERYSKELKGVDWPKISHIPNIQIERW